MKSKGFTLIELAVVLAIIAVLAAVLTPIVTGYLDQARVTRAQGDVRTIADAIKLYKRDTGQWPIYSASGQTNCCGGNGSNIVLIGGSNGNTPTANASLNWPATISTATATAVLETYLNSNLQTISTTNAFPKARFAGPYIGLLDSDAWGNRYLFTAQNLAANPNVNHAFVISAGPNNVLETNMTQNLNAGFAIGGDDIVALIQ